MRQGIVLSLTHLTAPRWPSKFSHAAAAFVLAIAGCATCFAQSQNQAQSQNHGETGAPPAAQSSSDQKPLTNDERAEMMKLIRSLQDRIEKLEAAQAARPPAPAQEPPMPLSAKP